MSIPSPRRSSTPTLTCPPKPPTGCPWASPPKATHSLNVEARLEAGIGVFSRGSLAGAQRDGPGRKSHEAFDARLASATARYFGQGGATRLARLQGGAQARHGELPRREAAGRRAL